MKLSKLFFTGLMFAVLAITPFAANARDGHDVRNDRKDIRHDERHLARNEAQRNRAIKNGHPNVAAHDERKVQHDRKDLRHDRKIYVTTEGAN